jgi:S-adenosylmethionine:tRNA ribosyltransferase-isomerase
MIAADRFDRVSAKLLAVGADGTMRRLPRAMLASLLKPGDLVVANDAATLPASLDGVVLPSGEAIEVRLAAWVRLGDPTEFVAIAFGAGDHRTPTEKRAPPPALSAGVRLALGPLEAFIEEPIEPPRLFRLRFMGCHAVIFAGLTQHGRPIQYAHVSRALSLRDTWTRIAAEPIAFEPPSAGFALDWSTVETWRRRGVGFVTLTLAAGISSTGSPALDLMLPFDEPYRVPESTAAAIDRAKSRDGRIVAIGTTVVRALESAATADGRVRAGMGIARGRVTPETPIRVADAILTGVHEPGESHFDLLRAFAPDPSLERMRAEVQKHRFRTHEFGDFVLIERSLGLSA